MLSESERISHLIEQIGGSGFAFDLIATPVIAERMGWAQWSGGVGIVLVSWGFIHLMLATADAAAHRTRAHFSTIFKDILMVTLWGVVLLVVLRQNFTVDLTPLLASTAVVAVVVGLALQESLGNIFSGLTLQLSKPFAPGDWVRSGNFVGRVQGIGWRSTAVITRANETLDGRPAGRPRLSACSYRNTPFCRQIAKGCP